MSEEEKEKTPTWKKIAAVLGFILLILTAANQGLFDAFFVTPSKLDALKQSIASHISNLDDTLDEQHIMIIKLQTQLDLIQVQLIRMEGKIDKGMHVGVDTGLSREAPK